VVEVLVDVDVLVVVEVLVDVDVLVVVVVVGACVVVVVVGAAVVVVVVVVPELAPNDNRIPNNDVIMTIQFLKYTTCQRQL
jgi:hypothetical protein